MPLAVLLLLLLAAFAGLAAGRRRVAAAAALAVIPCAVVGGPDLGALALLAVVALAAGAHLHRVVAETSVPRAG